MENQTRTVPNVPERGGQAHLHPKAGLLKQGRICETTYWYLDDVEEKAEDGFYSLPKPKAYKDFEAFLEGLLWNLEIARENGDEVPSEEYLLKQAWEHADWVSPCINGAYFAICTQQTVEDVWEN